jgi:K+-transporting ATPase A subunit
MKKNMGTADRSLRIVAAIAIAALYLTGNISGIAAIVLGVVAAVFVVSSAVGFCPGYLPLGISTRKEPTGAARV